MQSITSGGEFLYRRRRCLYRNEKNLQVETEEVHMTGAWLDVFNLE